MSLTHSDAARRAVVRLPNGKTGRLVYVPSRDRRPGSDHRAKVLLPSGKFVSVDPALLVWESFDA